MRAPRHAIIPVMSDANVGETTTAMVVSTGRVVRARITSRDEAQDVEQL